ncbi:kit ligand b isoform X2 [Neoarius graeffei]|uniref:kit ligand b isoform X2 n=1 Tax=Neoarius graeffei TaxID=443677 RepID=UPI00298BD109|nr:kit ligand b isoform X2 [Neoarius graeffei]
MKEAQIGCACVLVLLFSGLVACSGVFGNPLTDDVTTLDTLRENIPKDYKIRVRYISKDVGGMCWVYLNLYPAESSLKNLALKFGNLSANRENITIFITILQGLRFTIDNEQLESTMQAFKCHYRSTRWSTRRYFDHVKKVLVTFTSNPHQLDCIPPPCPTATAPPLMSDRRVITRAIPGVLALVVIPCLAALALIIRTVLHRKMCCTERRRDETNDMEPQNDPEASIDASLNNSESSFLNNQYRVQQVEDTGV